MENKLINKLMELAESATNDFNWYNKLNSSQDLTELINELEAIRDIIKILENKINLK